MEFTLTSTFEDCFDFKGQVINVDMTVHNILLVYELFDDEAVDKSMKPFITLEMLLEEYDSMAFDSIEEELELFKYVMKNFLRIDLDAYSDNENVNEDGEAETTKKTFDFKKDAGLIYASFLNYYHIDLFEQRDKMHWYKFDELLRTLMNLADKSPFAQVIGYRNMKIPKANNDNKDEIKRIRAMKDIYALNKNEVKDNTQGLNGLFNALSKQSEVNG